MNHSTTDPYFPENLDNFAPWVSLHGLRAPYGKCQCGCGEDAPLASKTNRKCLVVKDKPQRYIAWHFNPRNVAATPEDMFWFHCPRGDDDACWVWKGPLNHDGYGRLNFKRKSRFAHRFSYEIHCGSIPRGMQVLHHCDNPPCVNPKHLFLGNPAINALDKVLKGRHPSGEQCVQAKLTEGDVKEILRLHQSGMRQKEISIRFNIPQGSLYVIVRRINWRHVK